MAHRCQKKFSTSTKANCTKHGIDAVVRQQLQALVDLGLTVDLVSRGDPEFDGVSFRGMRWTPANALSWLPRSVYYPAQKRFFMAFGGPTCGSGRIFKNHQLEGSSASELSSRKKKRCEVLLEPRFHALEPIKCGRKNSTLASLLAGGNG
jgi:hypothetical protein